MSAFDIYNPEFHHFTVDRLKTLQLFVAAKNMTNEFKLNLKSLTGDELQDIFDLRDSKAIHVIVEDDVSIFPTYFTWTVLMWLQEHLSAKMSIETFDIYDYQLLSSLRCTQ
jgi:hypothetical protein